MKPNARLITCVLYRGASKRVLEALHREGINAASVYHARGSAIGDPVGPKGLPAEFEKEVLTVVVDAPQADDIFARIFELANIDRPYGGFLYMQRLSRRVPYQLPDVPEEDRD